MNSGPIFSLPAYALVLVRSLFPRLIFTSLVPESGNLNKAVGCESSALVLLTNSVVTSAREIHWVQVRANKRIAALMAVHSEVLRIP